MAVQLLCELLPLVDREATEAILDPLLYHLPEIADDPLMRRKWARCEPLPTHPSAGLALEEQEEEQEEEEEQGMEEDLPVAGEGRPEGRMGRSRCRHCQGVCSYAAVSTSLPASRALHFCHDEEDFSISNRSILRCASHMLVWESRPQGTGQGAFFRSCSPHHRSSPFIRANTILCRYGAQSIIDEELANLLSAELEYTLTVRRTLHFNSFR